MCGIYGIASNLKLGEELRELFSRIGSELIHRGPDGSTEILEDQLFSGFSRLAIVDVSNGMQPFYSEDKSIMVTGNGQIYNYLELREDLISKGHIFTSHCDLEVIPHLYEDYGDSFVDKIKGMFAIALVDRGHGELKLYVDSLGEKPIYWTMQDSQFIYSSELVPLLKSNLVKMDLDKDQIPNYIKYGYVRDPFTIVKGVYRVNGGTFLKFLISDGSLSQTKYRNFLQSYPNISNPITQLAQMWEEIAATICQGEAKVAVALSSGKDSGFVARSALRHNKNLTSITIGYSGNSRHDESHGASILAFEIGVSNELVKLAPSEAARALSEVCAVIDEPIADITSINYLKLFKFAKANGIRVVLMGHGADEIFFGYDWSLDALKRAEVRSLTLSGDFQIDLYWKLLMHFPYRWKTLSIISAIKILIRNNQIVMQIFHDLNDYRKGIKTIDFYDYNPEVFARKKFVKKLQRSIGARSKLDNVFEIYTEMDLVRKLQNQLIQDYLRINGFLQIDKLSMSQSIEVRSPLADIRLLDRFLMSNWNPMRLPAKAHFLSIFETLNFFSADRVSKKGFSPPTREWYREINRMYAEELSAPRVIQIGLLPPESLKYFAKPFRFRIVKSPIWFQLVFLELWVREIEQQVGAKFITQDNHTR